MNRSLDDFKGPEVILPKKRLSLEKRGKNFAIMGMHHRFG